MCVTTGSSRGKKDWITHVSGQTTILTIQLKQNLIWQFLIKLKAFILFTCQRQFLLAYVTCRLWTPSVQDQNQLLMIASASCNLKNTLRIIHRPLPFMLMNLPCWIKITLRKGNCRGSNSNCLSTSLRFYLRIPKYSQCQSGYLCSTVILPWLEHCAFEEDWISLYGLCCP